MDKTKQKYTKNQQLIENIKIQNKILKDMAEKFKVQGNIDKDKNLEIEKEKNNKNTN